jgi:3-oxoacyl-[acyl-carrier-protein] synthase-3
MSSKITALSYVLPKNCVTNEQLSREYPEWSVERIYEKTGITQRWICDVDECASDLGVKAAEDLISRTNTSVDSIDFILFCTQTPDYVLPTTACLIQSRLGIRRNAGALDFNLGCSGFVYGLGLAKGLVESGQAKTVLLITAETYSKLIDPSDRSVRTLFGDAGAATLIAASDGEGGIGQFSYGTDGSGGKNLIVRGGASRLPGCVFPDKNSPREAVQDSSCRLFMNGPEIMSFTLDVVPQLVADLLMRTSHSMESIDLFVFHQANRFMLEHLRKKCHIPVEKFVFALQNVGNTVSCSIPIALRECELAGRLKPGAHVMLVGFGVGYSWGGCVIQW